MTKEKSQQEMLWQLKTQVASEQGGGSHYWHLHRQHIRNRSLEAKRPHQIHRPLPDKHTSLSCSSTAPLWGWGGQCWEEEHTQNGNRASLTQPSGFLLQQLGSHPGPLYGGDGHWAEGKSWFTPNSGPSPFISSPTSYQGDSYQHILKIWLCSHQVQLFHQSRWTPTNCIGMLPNTCTCSRLLRVTVHLVS